MAGEMSNSELSHWLTRVEAKLDKVTDDHEQRLRRIEKSLYAAMGLAAAGATSGLSALLGMVGG